MTLDVDTLLAKFVAAVRDVGISVDAKAEVVINLAKAWGIDDGALRQRLVLAFGPDAGEHAYFYWQPRPRLAVGQRVRVVDGAPQALGRYGMVRAIEDPRRHGVVGMSKGYFVTIVLDGEQDPWGFREDQLEG